jgi:hypothetical protein
MSKRNRRHGHEGHGPQGHGPHHELDAQDPKPPGEVVTPPPPTPGEDVNLGVIVRFAVILGAVVAATSALVFGLMWGLAKRSAAGDPTGPQAPGAARAEDFEYGQSLARPDGGVRLQRRPFDDMDTMRTEETDMMDKYGWVDPKSRVVRIPITEAMKLVVQRGLPTRATYEPPALPAPGPAVPASAATAPPARPTPAAPRPTRRPAPKTPAPTAVPEAPAAPAPEAGE